MTELKNIACNDLGTMLFHLSRMCDAFRLARVTNEMGAGIAMKGLATLFGLGVVYFNLDMGAWRVDIFQGMSELRDRVEITQRSANWLAQSGISATDFPTHNLF